MKILFTYEYPFHKSGYGGGQQIIRDLSKSLVDFGHDVKVACLGTDELNLNEIDYPVSYEFMNKYKVGLNSFILTSFGSIKLLKKYKPDLVLSFSSESAIVSLYCKYKKIPFYIYIAAPYLPVFKIYKPFLYFKNIRYHLPLYLQNIGCAFSNKIFTISDFISYQALNNWHINKNKVLTIGCAISDDVINYSQKLSQSSTIRIATTGRIMYSQKPINILAKSLSNFKDINFEWHVIGTGKDLDDFNILLDKLDILKSTTLHSTLSTLEICKIYDNVDLIILPSYNESFFITAYEAICLNKILITNKVALLNKIFNKFKTIIFTDDVTVESYTDAIYKGIKLLKEDKIEINLLEASEFVKTNFNWRIISQNLIKNI